ncbi:hypothetical protein EYZ11_002463 [Aspergillus tanneri]|uniref:Uncharacterized protein n=1 Tax=Aspergillus tanneri TaxID=1220188 RepID=A0A4S3JT04_9EURO|nr:hypothetical protein EYZ11_002463 [Aspergillus tanneri]
MGILPIYNEPNIPECVHATL